MSDFLTRASEAALGVRRAVQPLVASRYAPDQRQPLLEIETVVDHPTAVGLASDAKSNELANRSRGVALSDLDDVHEQASEGQTRAEDRIGRSETGVMETVNSLPARSITARQEAAASTMQPDEYSEQATTEQKELSISASSEDRVPPDATVSIRPAATKVPESDEEPQGHRPTAAIAPLSVQSINIEAAKIEAAKTQTVATDAKAAGKSEVSERPGSPSFGPADRPELNDSPSGRRNAFVERRLDAAVREAVRDGDPARPPFNRFKDAAIVTNRGNEVGRTEPDSHLDQSLFDLRDERSSPDNSAHRPVATRHVSQSPATSDRGAQHAPEPPIIRVTIGRIEVRAAAPPAPPAETAAPPKPKMSLDEYLRQHNGRRP